MLLLFDFDGTLADSSPGIYRSFGLACTKLNLEIPPFQSFRDAIGPPVQRLAKRFFPDLTDSKIEEFRLIFRDDYDHYSFRQCDWYQGAQSTIAALAASPEMSLAIITNKPTNPTLELLKAGGILDCIQFVVGIDYRIRLNLGPEFATKTDAIQLALSLAKTRFSAAVYIGDTPSDREASANCGIQFIAATYGFHRWQNSELLNIKRVTAISDLISLLDGMVINDDAYTW